jgi:hypothetical protein
MKSTVFPLLAALSLLAPAGLALRAQDAPKPPAATAKLLPDDADAAWKVVEARAVTAEATAVATAVAATAPADQATVVVVAKARVRTDMVVAVAKVPVRSATAAAAAKAHPSVSESW